MRIVFFYILFFNFIVSQTWYNHSELNWKTFETDHFIFHYHEGTESTVSEAAYVAEKIYEPITSYYGYHPKTKTSIVIKDTDDIANGTAFYYDNKIEIWAHPLDFDLRGSHRWLQNVITHEFTHIVQIGSSMKASTRFPAIYLQGFTYEDEKREDVLYGYPNTMFSIPIPGVAVPPWLAEGTAQYMSPELNYDFWDSHRDMMLRDLVLNNQLLSFNQMNSFGKKGIGGEAVYNQGFSFSNYLLEKFGSSILPKISKELGKYSYSINEAILKSTNNQYSGYQLYDQWVNDLKKDYSEQLENVFDNMKKGKIIENRGTTNLFPKISPNGKKLAYISNQDNDYFGQTDLFIYDFIDSTKKKLISGTKYAPTWINDTTLIFTMRSKPNKFGSKYYNLFKMTLNQEKPDEITVDKRLRSPVYNANTNLIAAINTVDGLSNIYVSNLDSIDFYQVTNFTNQEYISTINWNEKGDKLYFDVIKNHGRDIYVVNINSNEVFIEIDNSDDCRNPFLKNENIYFSTDYNGIFNIAYKSLDDSVHYITNVPGGAFMPEISDNKLVYSLYEDGGYKLAMIENIKEVDNKLVGYKNNPDIQTSNIEIPVKLNYTDNSKNYEFSLTEFHIVPRVMIDYKTIKYGFYGFSEDVIGYLSLFSGFSINKLSDIDAMIMLEYKKLYPTLYANLFWATRNTSQNFDYYTVDDLIVDNIDIKNEVDYHLFSSDLGLRFTKFNFKFWLNYNYTLYNQKIYQTVTQDFISNGINQKIVSYGKLGFDYYRGNILSVRLSSKKIKPQFLGNMIPRNGYKFDLFVGYEWNDFMEGIALNEDYGTYGSVLKPNNTGRFDLNLTRYDYFDKYLISLENNVRVASLFNNEKDIDDFFYFFGGGLPGLKGYTFYDVDLTGKGIINHSIYFRKLFILSQFLAIKDYIGFNKLSLGFVFQYGGEFPAINIPKLSSGFEIRSKGFLFYGYPAAITFEQHYPISSESINFKERKSYFKLLFDF